MAKSGKEKSQMTLRDYLKTPQAKDLQAACYYGKNGRYYCIPIEKAKRSKAMDREIDQFIEHKNGKEIVWLY